MSKLDLSDLNEELSKTSKDSSLDLSDLNDDIAAAKQKEQKKIATEEKKKISMIESLLRGGGQGVSMGFGDEITGAVESTFTDKTYEQARDEARDANKAAQEANEWAYGGGQLVGNIATALVPGGAALNAAKTIKGAAGLGAVGGAIQGFGESEGSASKQLADTVEGAAIGGVGGTVAGSLGAGLGKIADSVKGKEYSQKLKYIYDQVKNKAKKYSGEGVVGNYTDTFDKSVANIADTGEQALIEARDNYGEVAKNLKVADPEKLIKDIDTYNNNLLDTQARTAGAEDVRDLNKQINELRSQQIINDQKAKALTSEVKTRAEGVVDTLNPVSDEKLKLKRLKEDLRIAKKGKEANDLRFEIRELEDYITKTRRIAKGSSQPSKLSGELGSKAKIDEIRMQHNELQQQIDQLIQRRDSRAHNKSLNQVVEDLDSAKKVDYNNSNYIELKKGIQSSVDNAAVGPFGDVSGDFRNILRENVPGAKELDAEFANEISKANILGATNLDPNLYPSDEVLKKVNLKGSITSKLKADAVGNDFSVAAMKARALKEAYKDSPKMLEALEKGAGSAKDLAVASEISKTSYKNLGGIGLQGAEIVGNAANSSAAKVGGALVSGVDKLITIPNTVADNIIKKLGANSKLGQKALEIVRMPEGESKQRLLFNMMQQPLYRKLLSPATDATIKRSNEVLDFTEDEEANKPIK